jgi:uncharacterized protein (DUF2249 family)
MSATRRASKTTNPKKKGRPPELVLDVRNVAPPGRHPLIFGTYAQLTPEQSFVLVNDHDPKPLFYQFQAEHTGEFSWEYLEQGPSTWRVRIGRAKPPAGRTPIEVLH